jgi:hypothetical protein
MYKSKPRMKILTKCLLISVLVLLVRHDTRAQEKPGNPDYAWLAGRWSGTPALGGSMTIDFQIVNGNEIKGKAWLHGIRKPSGATATHETNIWGKITDTGVVDVTFGWPTGHIRYVLKRNEDGNLQGIKDQKILFFKDQEKKQ